MHPDQSQSFLHPSHDVGDDFIAGESNDVPALLGQFAIALAILSEALGVGVVIIAIELNRGPAGEMRKVETVSADRMLANLGYLGATLPGFPK